MNTTLAIGAVVLLGAFYAWTSRINGIFFFGRSAGPALRTGAAGQTITRQYLVAVAATTCIATLLAWFAGLAGKPFAAIAIFVQLFALWTIFARANRQVRALEVAQGERAVRDIVQVPLLETPAYWIPGLLLSLLPAVIASTAFAAAILLTKKGIDWSRAFGAWNKSLEANHLDTLCGLSLGLLFAATLLLLIFRRSVRLRTTMAQYSVRASVVMQCIGVALLLTVLGCNSLGLSLNEHINKIFIVAGFFAALGTVAWNQSRARRFVPPPVELGADDRWRWGLFYADRDDPALFVQSRCGTGYTLNYGRMMAWPISLATVAYFVSMLFLTSHR